MQIVIDIPEEVYDYWKEHKCEYVLAEAIANATPLTDCDNAVSRKEVKELLDEYYAELTLDETALKSNAIAIKVTRNIMNDIEALPSVNPTTDLSKIRAEIEDYMMNFADSDSDNFIEFTAGLVLRQSCPYVLAIIDKYKGGDSDA